MAVLSTWCRTFVHTREKEVFFLSARKISLAPTPQEGPFQVLFAGTSHTEEQKELNTRERRGQDATKTTSAFADSCIQFLWSVMPILMTTLTWMVRNSPNRYTIEEFTEEIDEAGCVGQYISFLLPAKKNVVSDRWSRDDDRLREDYYYEALAFSRHSTNLELDEELTKPEKFTQAPRNSGTDPSIMKLKQWYRGQDSLSDKSQWQWPSNRASDEQVPTGTDRASCQAREPIEDDGEACDEIR